MYQIGRLLCTVGRDQQMILWDTFTKVNVKMPSKYQPPLYCVYGEETPDRCVLLSLSCESKVQFIRGETEHKQTKAQTILTFHLVLQ